jgi:hypothetical protein
MSGLNDFEKFIDELANQFESRISKKTGWGKNEVIDAFKDSVICSISKCITIERYTGEEKKPPEESGMPWSVD